MGTTAQPTAVIVINWQLSVGQGHQGGLTVKIQIYGKGCAKCNRLTENVKKALEELGRPDVEVEHVKDLDAIVRLGPVMTPVLVVDGQILSQGVAASPRKVAKLLEPLLGQSSQA